MNHLTLCTALTGLAIATTAAPAAPAYPEGGLRVALEAPFADLRLEFPTVALQPPGDPGRWLVAERAGRVVSFPAGTDTPGTATVIDLRGQVSTEGEGGLLGMAFHPDFAHNGQVFLSYTRPGRPLLSYVSRFRSADGAATVDAASEQPLLRVQQPYANHNGGHIAFGPDGYLYIGLGDGGAANDPHGNGQDSATLLGALLRLDVERGSPYAIPPDNPFAAAGGRPEIYAWGLRNPWRFNFDRVSGELWLADVGQERWEEVNRIERGGNYGWNIREGAHCFAAATCRSAGLQDPVAEYDHSLGCSITGGYVYRGKAIPELIGAYVYGDYCSGRIWGLFGAAPAAIEPRLLLESGIPIVSFAEDLAGELYVLGAGGQMQRLIAATQLAAPDSMSERAIEWEHSSAGASTHALLQQRRPLGGGPALHGRPAGAPGAAGGAGAHRAAALLRAPRPASDR